VRAFGGEGYDAATAVAVDPTGAVYVAGELRSAAATFGGDVVLARPNSEAHSMDGTGGGHAFVVKLSSSGSVEWAVATDSATGNAAAAALVYSPYHQVGEHMSVSDALSSHRRLW
jgi:hypothetical protein